MKEDDSNIQSSPGMNLMDLEERQKIIKDRLILIGQNLIDLKGKYDEEVTSLKRDIESLKDSVERIKDFMETISSEFQKFARKDDLEILKKQAKIFQPLEFATKEDLEKLKSKKTMK
jgi:predicted RNase H-like nuclease (RuvC/YqgF family)